MPFTDLEKEVVRQMKALRIAAGLDQDQMGLPVNTYGTIERELRHVTFAQLDRIVAAIMATGQTDLEGVADLFRRAEKVLEVKASRLG